jgi:hypothetical protein
MSNPNPAPRPENLTRAGMGQPKKGHKRIQVVGPPHVLDAVKAYAKAHKLDISQVAVAAFEQYLSINSQIIEGQKIMLLDPAYVQAKTLCPRFQNFLDKAVGPEQAKLVQALIRIALEKNQPIRIMPYCTGSPGTGKSVLLQVLLQLAKEDAATWQQEDLKPSAQRRHLVGKKVAVCHDFYGALSKRHADKLIDLIDSDFSADGGIMFWAASSQPLGVKGALVHSLARRVLPIKFDYNPEAVAGGRNFTSELSEILVWVQSVSVADAHDTIHRAQLAAQS